MEGAGNLIIRSSRQIAEEIYDRFHSLGITRTQVDNLLNQLSGDIGKLQHLADVLDPHKGIDNFQDLVNDLVKVEGKELAEKLATVSVEEGAIAITAWKNLLDEGVDPSIRRNIDALTDPDAAIDAIQTSQKTKPAWPEIKALFKRGNDFNAKGRLEYEYNEINLVDGKRLDSYIPGEEIVSRKATTLSEINMSTFENYLKELTTKYKKGKIIRSNKYKDGPGAIDGDPLSGEYFLEIPSSNQLYYEASTELKNLAIQYDVQIKYLDE